MCSQPHNVGNMMWLSHLTHEETRATEEGSLVYSHRQVSGQAGSCMQAYHCNCLSSLDDERQPSKQFPSNTNDLQSMPECTLGDTTFSASVHVHTWGMEQGLFLGGWECLRAVPGLVVGSHGREFKSQFCPCALLD